LDNALIRRLLGDGMLEGIYRNSRDDHPVVTTFMVAGDAGTTVTARLTFDLEAVLAMWALPRIGLEPGPIGLAACRARTCDGHGLVDVRLHVRDAGGEHYVTWELDTDPTELHPLANSVLARTWSRLRIKSADTFDQRTVDELEDGYTRLLVAWAFETGSITRKTSTAITVTGHDPREHPITVVFSGEEDIGAWGPGWRLHSVAASVVIGTEHVEATPLKLRDFELSSGDLTSALLHLRGPSPA
jgi:hypothetical protein